MRPGIGSLENVQAVAQTWTLHRLEDFERAMESLRQIAESKDFVQAAAIQQKWLADCTQRLVADWTALVTATTRQSAELGRDLKKAAG